MSNGKKFTFECTICHMKSGISIDELKKARNEKRVILQCMNPKCGAWNLTDKPKVNKTITEVDKSDGGQACECIPFTGEEAKLPRGKNIYADGMITYGPGDSTEQLTREDYLFTYHIDPEVVWKREWDGRIKPPTMMINPGFKRPPVMKIGLVGNS